MLDMHNYICILCMYIVFIQNIIVLFDIFIFPYLFPNIEISPTLTHDAIIMITNVSTFDVRIMMVVYLCNLAIHCQTLED